MIPALGSLTLSWENKVENSATRVTASSDLRPFEEQIVKRREVVKTQRALEKMQTKSNVHEIMRQKICSGKVELSYRDVQRLCTLNNLGAKGTKAVLSKRLVTFLERVAPETLHNMTNWQIRNIRYNLDGDKDKEYEEAFKESVTLEKGWTSVEKLSERRARRWLLSQSRFVADLAYETERRKELAEQEKARTLHDRVNGKFYAAPAPTGRATCRLCREKIAKGSVRVSEHILSRRYHLGGAWTAQQTVHHRHAICFLDHSATFGKDALVSDIKDEDLSILRDKLMEENEYWEKDKEWNHMLTGPVGLKYPSNAISFGYEDPSRIRTTAFRNDDGLLVVTSKYVKKK